MASLTHSRQPAKLHGAVSKKIKGTTGTGGFPAETLYDHVYGGAAKFDSGHHSLSPRFEDYGEIFASFHALRASAIPVLDLPALDGGEVFFDFRNAACDYAKIFRAFHGLDFWLSYEDLFRDGDSDRDDDDEEEEEEAWSPVETDSFSGDLDHFGNNQGMLNGDHLRSLDGSTEFKVSHDKVNGASDEENSKGKSHISQLDGVPEFTHVFEETKHFHRTYPSLQVVDDVDLDMEFNASQAKRNRLRKTVSSPGNFNSGEQVLGSDFDLHDRCRRNVSQSGETFVTVSDICLRTLPSHVPPPSRPPPALDAKQGYTSGFHSNNEGVDSEETLGVTSRPFLDVEVDMNSSAAAIKEVMHRGEAQLRSAKELKERKKVVFESKVSYDVKNNEAKMNVNISRFKSLDDEGMQTTCDQRIGKKKSSDADDMQKTRKAALEPLDLLEGERLLNMFEEKHIKESRSSQESDRSTGVGMWKAATGFFELLGTESGKVTQQIPEHAHTKSWVQDTRTHEHDKKEREAFNIKEEYKKVKEVVEGYQLEECKKKSKAGNGAYYEQGKNIKKSKSSNEECRQREHGKNGEMSEIFELEKSENEGLKHADEQVENEKRHKQDPELEMNEKRTKVTIVLMENEACERDQGKEKLSEICDGYGTGNRQNDVVGSIGVRKVLKQAPGLEMNYGNEAQRKKEMESPSDQAFDREGIVDMSGDDSHSNQSGSMLKDADKNVKIKELEKALEQKEGNGEGIYMNFTKENNEEWKTKMDENLLSDHSSIPEENIPKPEVCEEPIAKQEIGKTGTYCKVGEQKLEGGCVENLKNSGEKGASEKSQGEAEHSGRVAYAATNVNGDEHSFSCEQTHTEKAKTTTQMEFDHQIKERKIAHEWGEREKTKQHVNVALNPLESRDQMLSNQANLCGDYRRNTVADESATVQEAVNIQKPSQMAHVSHSTKIEEKSLNETSASADKDAERITKERELERDRLRQIEEEMERERERRKDRMDVDRAMLEAEREREREREREKDRMAVDKATLDGRDRTYAEARERAERAAFERATAEARQRTLAQARERLGKACAEARDKIYADKASAEARLKAERTAVERATAEARERATEKVKVERAAFESRERLERSVSDKFSVSFRNGGRQGSSSSDMLDPDFQIFNSSTRSRYALSSVYGASSFSERSEGEGESAQRCRARLERYHRTAERAAKALEEKNMRDLVVQKEHAERNRLAETLDTEVRRWSSGKEGNLRALISTLQYILGANSGWQPIPLTDVITSTAVKKAYRKATLCVHPDKLQQRGASIQHKYICEKVFDLLKEAWNKFNSEEQ